MKSKYDINLLCATLLLAVIGIVMVSSATQVIAMERYGSPYYYMKQEAMHFGIGLLMMLVCSRIPYENYRKISSGAVLVSLLCLSAVLIFGREVRGARRWLTVYGVTMQPVEFVKYSFVIFVADLITRRRGTVRKFKRGFLPVFLVSLCFAALLVFQPNISNAALIVGLAIVLLFLGRCRISHLTACYGSLIVLSAPYIYLRPHVYSRFLGMFNRGEYALGQNWHIRQSLISLGSGFIFGCGPGRGRQKFNFLPDAHTDFIYSIIGEELGLIGTIMVLSIYIFIFFRVLRIAQNAPNTFGRFLAFGIGLVIFSTALVNVAMTTGLIPTVGLPLPFISYGGSSLVTSLAATGILLNISSKARGGGFSSGAAAGGGKARPVFARRNKDKEGVKGR